MSVRGALGGAVAATAVLVIGWQIGTAGAHATSASTTTTSGSSGSGSSGSGSSGSSSSGTSSSGSSSSGASSSGTSSSGSSSGSSSTTTTGAYKDGTYTGESITTRYGDMQVKVTISGGKITDVTALQITDREPRSEQISQQAVPILREEVLKAQSAKVDYVSGATYSSDGYLQSLQSALDQAAS